MAGTALEALKDEDVYVVATTAGTRLPAQRLSPSRLRDAIARRHGAERLAALFASAGGAAAAVDAFERAIDRRPSAAL